MDLRTFTFGGTASSTYSMFITEAATYNVPERAVEMLEIPGRNGAYALDQGRFENVEVTYHVVVHATNNSGFQTEFSDVRNWLASQVGYQRLEDDYNSGVYRMAIFKGGLETSEAFVNGAEFDVVFECKPQRWLTSGEIPIEIGAWGDTQTVSGDIVQFSALETDKVKSLVADIDPIQDLHGYDAPWAGGAGKNILNVGSRVSQTTAGVTYTSNDNYVILNDTKSGGGYADLSTLTLSLGAGVYYARAFVISGTESADVAGLYVYDGSTNLTPSSIIGTERQFTLSEDKTIRFRFGIFTDGVVFTNWTIGIVISKTSGITSWTPYENICPISGWNSVEVTVTDDLVDPTDTDTYTTSLGTTVYGGTLDLVSGELTVTHASQSVNSVIGKTENANGYYWYATALSLNIPTIKGLNAGLISDRFEPIFNVGASSPDGKITFYANNIIRWKEKGSLSSNDYGTYLQSNPFQIVYELETPTTYTLTPAQVDLLLGQNTVFADTGDVTVEYGQDPMVLINPTPFDASPLLAVKGYGNIDMGGQDIDIQSVPLGEIVIYGNEADYTALTRTVTLDVSRVNSADTIAASCVFDIRFKTRHSKYFTSFAIGTETDCSSSWVKFGTTQYDFYITPTNLDFVKGTSATKTCSVAFNAGINGTNYAWTITCSVAYDGDDTLTLSASYSSGASMYVNFYKYAKMQETTADSTMSALGNPMYIDLDIGEAWNEDSGEPVSVNNAVTLPSDLPKLPPGATTFTMDGTVTELKVTPRWWKV